MAGGAEGGARAEAGEWEGGQGGGGVIETGGRAARGGGAQPQTRLLRYQPLGEDVI